MNHVAAVRRGLALLGTATAAAAIVASAAAAPASAATFSSVAKPAAPSAVHPDLTVHPGVITYPDCGENFLFNSNNVRIRASYGTSSAVRGYGEKGQTFDGEYVTQYTYNGYYWVYGYDFETGVTGYVARSLLNADGPVGCTVLS